MQLLAHNPWYKDLIKEISQPYFQELEAKINQAYAQNSIFPLKEHIFQALELTPLDRVKVLILGQDPYHNENQAHGLAFSVMPGVGIPPSLANIYKELHNDLGCDIPNHGHLRKWAEQGVLLLNTVLTVKAHEPNSHQGIGWELFTDAIIRKINEQDRPIVIFLWGKPAQKKQALLTHPKHLILKAPHPSPLSAYRGFFGCKHFSKANAFLKASHQSIIDWDLTR